MKSYLEDEIEGFDSFSGYDTEELRENFLGIGKRNLEKKANKKLDKAEKQLSKGHIAAAKRKTEKAEKILEPLRNAQEKVLTLRDVKANIDANKIALDTTNPNVTESMQTQPGQIGANAGSMSAVGSSGGSTGGYSFSPDDSNPATSISETSSPNSDEPTGDLATEKELPGVTVTSGKNNTIIFIIVGAVVLYLAYKFLLKKK